MAFYGSGIVFVLNDSEKQTFGVMKKVAHEMINVVEALAFMAAAAGAVYGLHLIIA